MFWYCISSVISKIVFTDFEKVILIDPIIFLFAKLTVKFKSKFDMVK